MPPAPEPSSRLSGNESSRPNRRPAVVLRASPPGSFAIFCGAHEPITSDNILESDYDEHRPGVVQILPETLSFSSPVYKKARTTRSNGCGTRLHGAMSSPRSSQSRTVNQPQCWYGEEKNVAETVVPLERRYFPQTLWEALDLCHDIGTAACGCVMNGVGCAVCGNPLGAVQAYCSSHSFRGSNAPRKGSTYIFAHSAVTAAPSSLPRAPNSNASSASAVDPALTMPLPPAQTAADNLFGNDFIQSVADGLDEFVDVGLFRGDGDLNFERDFGQWFNPDDVDMLPQSPNSNASPSASSASTIEPAPPDDAATARTTAAGDPPTCGERAGRVRRRWAAPRGRGPQLRAGLWAVVRPGRSGHGPWQTNRTHDARRHPSRASSDACQLPPPPRHHSRSGPSPARAVAARFTVRRAVSAAPQWRGGCVTLTSGGLLGEHHEAEARSGRGCASTALIMTCASRLSWRGGGGDARRREASAQRASAVERLRRRPTPAPRNATHGSTTVSNGCRQALQSRARSHFPVPPSDRAAAAAPVRAQETLKG
ncbi:hypothetical protein MSAN_01534300 [Mycena sanguinolenta]|uniref:Uncharacterized protein n=1 Tax=Mycena sanguinolenta TaxID=230812 RepID=A0A8H6Y7R9_9AGAR|nr:hypothetical protein MSAN_01534300 [Mycena sanguinolenta]